MLNRASFVLYDSISFRSTPAVADRFCAQRCLTIGERQLQGDGIVLRINDIGLQIMIIWAR